MQLNRLTDQAYHDMTLTTENIAAISDKLKTMPAVKTKPPRVLSKAAAIRALSKEISDMQKRGYSLDLISAALRENGVDVSTNTLKSSLQRAKVHAA